MVNDMWLCAVTHTLNSIHISKPHLVPYNGMFLFSHSYTQNAKRRCYYIFRFKCTRVSLFGILMDFIPIRVMSRMEGARVKGGSKANSEEPFNPRKSMKHIVLSLFK